MSDPNPYRFTTRAEIAAYFIGLRHALAEWSVPTTALLRHLNEQEQAALAALGLDLPQRAGQQILEAR